jgi:hypothetical protein
MANDTSHSRIPESIPQQNDQEIAQLTTNDENVQVVNNEEFVRESPQTLNETNHGAEQMVDRLLGVDTHKWIYVSKLHPNTSADDIICYVSSKLNLPRDKIKCSKLVAGDADLSKMEYVSFKLYVRSPKFSDLLVNDFWPSNIISREFNKKQNFRLSHRKSNHKPMTASASTTKM